jgi:uncharacterized protein YdaU (DUF1376 family)
MKKRKLCDIDQERVDMFLPLFCRDFLMSTIGWSAAQRGHYLTLLMVQWDAGFLPVEIDALERISFGVSEAWDLLEDKFPVSKDGLRRNQRLEDHRETAVQIRKKRRENGRKGGKPKGNQMGNQMVTQMVNQSQALAQPGLEHPEPEPEPQSISLERDTQASPSLQESGGTAKPAGYALPEWQTFLDAWNAAAASCRHIARYGSLYPPQTFLDRYDEVGWRAEWRSGIERLKRCQWFTTPVSLTFFLKPDTLQSVLAGQFDPKKPAKPGEPEQRQPVVSTRVWRDDACQNMTDEQYAAWRRKQTQRKEVTT